MAASSGSSSAAKEYDVFISFRGEDTRYNFTSHLVSALRQNSVRVYVDYELRKGDEISPSLINAIHDSYGSLIIFSENYAFSKWCLNEILTILEQRKQGHFIVPVFYNIDPSHVRQQVGSYEKAFAKHEDDPQNKEMLQPWKAALTEAASIVGWDSQSPTNRDESELIANIVNDILQKMNQIYQTEQIEESGLVGIDRYCKDIESLLKRYLVVGIWGMGGVGKTTIAKVVFDKLFCQFDSSYFFENIREESERNGINYIRDKLLSELLKDEIFHNNTSKAPALKYAIRRLRSKKVLIVLDDVNSFKQLEYLQQERNCLREANSRIIITTRDKHLLNDFRDHHAVYKVQGLNFEKSLQLFSLYAFNESYPKIGYKEITKKFVDYAGGIPLALKVLGRFLFSKSKAEWESALEKLNKIPNNDIHDVLRLSYDGLDPLEQQIFLDIACFFKGEYIEHVISCLDSCGFYGCIGIRSLQDKALVTIYGGVVQMHDLIEEMSRHIVCGVSINNPGDHSRLWDPEEIYDVLKNNKGTDRIEGIRFNMSKIIDLPLNNDTFKKMTNLRFLEFYTFSDTISSRRYCPGGFELSSDKLNYFHWDRFPFHSLPSNFCAEKLVMLRMPFGNMTKLWDGFQNVVNLKVIELAECHQLTEIPDLSNASKLERVDLSWCTSLYHIHPSLLHLDTLVELDVDNCGNVTSLVSESHLKNLERLTFHGCISLKEFSLSSEKMKELWFWETAVDILSPSMVRCRNLKKLDFIGRYTKISSPMSKLTSVLILAIEDCRGFDSSKLHVMFDALPSLEELHLIDCEELFQLPDNISVLSSLNMLRLERSSVESLPTSIKHLPCLKHLDVSCCQRLRSLPELPPSLVILKARNCSSLKLLFPSTALKHCDLEGCVKLDQKSLISMVACAYCKIKQAAQTTFCLPGNRIPWWFSYRTTEQSRISIEMPPHSNLLGFAFGFTASNHIFRVACACYLEDSKTLKLREWDVGNNVFPYNVYLWYDHSISCYLNAMETRVGDRVSFRLLAFSGDLGCWIKEFGVWPIYAQELELESGDKSKRIRSELVFDEQQLPLPKKLRKCQPEMELDLNTGIHRILDFQEIEIEGSAFDHENQDEQETLLNDKKLLREFNFQLLPTESQVLNDFNEAFDFFEVSEQGDKFKRCQCDPEGDEQLQLSLIKKSKESTVQPVLVGLELELGTKSHKHLEIEGIQVGGAGLEMQDEQKLCIDKGIQGI